MSVSTIPTQECTVKFKVVDFADYRKHGSTLEIGNEYIGHFRPKNNSIWWTDPGNDQNWVFWLNDTAEIIEIMKGD